MRRYWAFSLSKDILTEFKMIVYAFVLLFSLLISSCSEDDSDIERVGKKNPVFNSFSLRDKEGHIYNSFLITDSLIHIKIPRDAELGSLIPYFKLDSGYSDSIIEKDSSFVESGKSTFDFSDFTNPVCFWTTSSQGDINKYKILLYELPILIIDTPNNQPILNKEERLSGCQIKLVSECSDSIIELGDAGVRGRGNSSWLLPKKPYDIKLSKKHEILGMAKSKHWVLLANAYYDRTQLHNATAYEMARLTDYPWVQSGEFVDLIINGNHVGLYYLCEKIRLEKERIDISEIGSDDIEGELLSGGYLLESAVGDNYVSPLVTDYFNKTGRGFIYRLGWEFKHPDDIKPEQFSYVLDTMNKMESLIWNLDSLANGNYRNYLDIETAINWWLVEEAALNEEASRTKNLYLYKKKNGPFCIGPPWDFDAWTFGVYGTSHFYCTKTSFYFEKLFKDSYFINRLKEKWRVYKRLWENEIPKFIDSQYNKILRSALRNEAMWPDLCPEYSSYEKSYSQSVKEMKDALFIQLNWMDISISNNYFVDWWDENAAK